MSLELFNISRSEGHSKVVLETISRLIGQLTMALGLTCDAIAAFILVSTLVMPGLLPWIHVLSPLVLTLVASFLFLIGAFSLIGTAILKHLRQLYRFDCEKRQLWIESRAGQSTKLPSLLSFDALQGFTLKKLVRPDNNKLRFCFLELHLHSGENLMMTAFKDGKKAQRIVDMLCSRTGLPYQEETVIKLSFDDLNRNLGKD